MRKRNGAYQVIIERKPIIISTDELGIALQIANEYFEKEDIDKYTLRIGNQVVLESRRKSDEGPWRKS